MGIDGISQTESRFTRSVDTSSIEKSSLAANPAKARALQWKDGMEDPRVDERRQRALKVAGAVSTESPAPAAPSYAAFAKGVGEVLDRTKEDTFTVFGDTNHSGTEKYKALASPETLDALQSHNVKVLALETRAEFQPLVDQLKNDSHTPDQYAAAIKSKYEEVLGDEGVTAALAKSGTTKEQVLSSVENRAREEGKLIKNALAKGIRPACVETQYPTLTAHTEAVLNEMAAAQERGRTLTALHEKLKQAPPDQKAQVAAELKDAYAKRSPWDVARAKHDEILKDNVIKKARSNPEDANSPLEKTVVLYGNAHGKGDSDLDEFLGAKRIDIVEGDGTRTADEIANRQAEIVAKMGKPGYVGPTISDPPDGVLATTGALKWLR